MDNGLRGSNVHAIHCTSGPEPRVNSEPVAIAGDSAGKCQLEAAILAGL